MVVLLVCWFRSMLSSLFVLMAGEFDGRRLDVLFIGSLICQILGGLFVGWLGG